MQITNGTVEYSRTVKPADYESKAAKVSLTFAVEETEANPDAVVAKVFDMAMGEVHRRLGLNGPAVAHTAQVEKPAAGKKGAAAAPQPDPMNMAPSAPVSPTNAATAPSVTVAPASPDPLAITPPATAPADTGPITITDNDLHAAIHQAVERKVLPSQVRELTAEFTGVVGQSMTTIAQDKRPAFLARVKELRPNA